MNKKNVRGVVSEIALPEDAHLFQGQRRTEHAQLEGRAYKGTSPTGWAGQTADPTEDRLKIEWVVRAAPGSTIEVSARHERAGKISKSVTL